MPRLSAAQRERDSHWYGPPGSHCATVTWSMDRFRQTNDRARNGRPCVTMPIEDCYLPILHLRNCVLPVTTTASTTLEHRISRPTGSTRLPEHGIRARRPYLE